MVAAQQWKEVEVLDLECCTRGAISGKKKNTVGGAVFFSPFSAEKKLNVVIG